MTFDNAAFESKAKATIDTLNQLKQSLQFDGATRGLENLSSSTKNFNLDGIAAGIETINSKFSAMGAVAFSTIQSITNRAIDAGIQLGKSLSLNQVLSGFQEYQTNINSIQTILANTKSKGTTLDDVNSALDELNEYSDRTIYNFSQMAKNIGTFTAAGVDLERSVGAIKGIANLAAISGASAEQASNAMYQLSQAVATGTVRLIDWNSVQNASLGGEFFQRQLFETGKALGTIQGITLDTTFEEWTKANGSFRNSLAGSGEEVLDETEMLAKANAEAAKIIGTAEKDLADASENSNERIADAKKRVSDSATQGAAAIENASERQRRTIEDDAKSIKDAWNDVIESRERLERAMRPASENELQAAQDNLLSSQLDQLDLADAVTRAEQQQNKALDRETKARQKLAAAQKTNDFEAISAATFELQDAQNAVADSADAITRAQIAQRAAARDLTGAQEALTEVQKKGTEADENLAAAKQDLETAEQRYAREISDSAKRQTDAANDVAQAREDSARRQEEAVKNLAAVEEDKVTSIERLQDRLAKAHEDAAARITAAGGNAEETWLNDEVLLTTLRGIAGELSYDEARALGFSEEAAKQIVAAGELGNESATSVKTLTQLLSTLRESVGSGWAQTFRTVFGTFEEAKETFTRFNDALGLVSQKSADTRNTILNGWKVLGGRRLLVDSIVLAFKSLGEILGAVRAGFREIFPRKTSLELFRATQSLFNFIEKLRASPQTLEKIQTIFAGFFSIIKIGFEVIKGAVRIFGALLSVFTGIAGDSSILGFFAKIGEVFVNLGKKLVDGGGIANFVQNIIDGIEKIKPFIQAFARIIGTVVVFAANTFIDVLQLLGKALLWIGKNTGGLLIGAFKKIASAFSKVADGGKSIVKVVGDGTGDGTTLGGGLDYLAKVGDRLTQIWGGLVKAVKKIKDAFSSFAAVVWDALDGVWEAISETFGEAKFDQVLDAVNVGLVGGFLAILGKFLNGGLGRFLVGGDVLKSISGVFEGLTGALQAMQLSIKAGAIMKIAQALAILTVSVVVLSLIDSAALTKAFIAITVGFGQMAAMLFALSAIGDGLSDVKTIVALSGALSLIGVAVLIMAGALALLGTVDPLRLAAASAALVPIGFFFKEMLDTFKKTKDISIKDVIKSSIGIIAIGRAVMSIAKSVQRLGSMDTGDFTQGMLGVTGILTGLIAALRNMPKDNDKFQGLLGLGVAIYIIGRVIDRLGNMDPEALLRGLAAFSTIMLAIGYALLSLDGVKLETIGPALLGVGAAVLALAIALAIIARIDGENLAKGIAAIAGVVYALAIALMVMTGSLPGAYALIVAAGAIVILALAFQQFEKVGLGEILKGLLALAGVIGVVAGMAALLGAVPPLIPAMIALGIALILVGAGMALLGLGAKFAAEALETATRAGKEGMDIFKDLLGVIISVIPEFMMGFADGILQLAELLVEMAPKLVKGLIEIVIQLLQGAREILPELMVTIAEFVDSLLIFLKDEWPRLQDAGFAFLLEFLRGLAENAEEITDATNDVFLEILKGLAGNAGELAGAGLAVLSNFLIGISENVEPVIEAGTKVLLQLLASMTENGREVTRAVGEFLGVMLIEIGAQTEAVGKIGLAILVGILDKMISSGDTIGEKVKALIVALAKKFIEVLDTAGEAFNKVVEAGVKFVSVILNSMLDGILDVTKEMIAFVTGLLNGMADVVRTGGPEVRGAASNLAHAILDQVKDTVKNGAVGFFDAIVPGKGIPGVELFPKAEVKTSVDQIATAIASAAGSVQNKAKLYGAGAGMATSVQNGWIKKLQIQSPSKVFMRLAEFIPAGIVQSLDADATAESSAANLAGRITDTVAKSFAVIPAFDTIGDINPVISPVLDLTQVQRDAAAMNGIFGQNGITAGVSYGQASALSLATTASMNSATNAAPMVKEVKFEQIINSPTTLSNADIYRQTRSQIQLAKEELTR
jgi:tape measure domain-containing protein